MNLEEYQKKYSKWNFYEKLENIYSEAKWIGIELKKVVNWTEAYEYVMELADAWESKAQFYLADVELECIHKYIKDTIKYLECLKKDYFYPRGVDKLLFYEMMRDIEMSINLFLPKDIKMKKILFEMQEKAEEIASLLEIEPNAFFALMEKMANNSDKISEIIDFQRTFR